MKESVYEKSRLQDETEILEMVSQIIKRYECTCDSILDIEDLNYLYDIEHTSFRLDTFLKNQGFIPKDVEFYTDNTLSDKNFLTRKEANDLALKILKDWENNNCYELDVEEYLHNGYII